MAPLPPPADRAPEDDDEDVFGAFAPEDVRASRPSDRRGRDDAPPFGRRRDDQALHEIAEKVAEINASGGRGPFWRRWSPSEWLAVAGLLTLGMAAVRWAAHTASQPAAEASAAVVSLTQEFRAFARGSVAWRTRFERRDQEQTLDICRALKRVPDEQCFADYRSGRADTRAESPPREREVDRTPESP